MLEEVNLHKETELQHYKEKIDILEKHEKELKLQLTSLQREIQKYQMKS